MPKTNTPIFDELRKLYAKCPQLNFDEDITHHLKYGYVFSGPNYFLMGERIGLGWHIYCAAGTGAIQHFGSLMPYFLPFIGWSRCANNQPETIWYRTESVFRRLNMKLTPEQEFEKCRFAAANLVAQYRSLAPKGFDVYALGGGVPKAPKPPAPPTANQASTTLLNQGKKRKPMGYQSTILGGSKPNNAGTPDISNILGG